MERELQILREAALISMSKKEILKNANNELEALREAALHSARERHVSSDLQRKRRLESPPSHHFNTSGLNEYDAYISENDKTPGKTTPKMSERDFRQLTPPPQVENNNTVFTVKVHDTVLLKRSGSDEGFPTSPLRSQVNNKKITIKLTTEKLPDLTEDKMTSESEDNVMEIDDVPLPQALPSPPPAPKTPKYTKDKMPSSVITPAPTPKPAEIKPASPTFSKVSSADDISPEPSKKSKKKHKKKKSSKAKTKKSKHYSSSSEEDVPPKKISKHHHQTGQKMSKPPKTNGVHKTRSRAPESPPEKNHKKHQLSELDLAIDRNIEHLHKLKKQKHEHKDKPSKPPSDTKHKKILSEFNDILSGISSDEALSKKSDRKRVEPPRPEKRRSLSPPKKDVSAKVSPTKDEKSHHAKTSKRSKDDDASSAVSLTSKREFERIKAELNKNVPTVKSKKSDREKRTKSPKKVNVKATEPLFPGQKVDMISEKEEKELLGEEEDEKGDGDCVMKDESISDSDDDNDMVNILTDKKPSDSKRKKSKKSKKKKHKDDSGKKKKKKKRKRSGSLSSDDDDSSSARKPKVKIDKSELNKIVQFLKQRDEAQRSQDGSKNTFNPKIINKESKPIEIKIKSKPKR